MSTLQEKVTGKGNVSIFRTSFCVRSRRKKIPKEVTKLTQKSEQIETEEKVKMGVVIIETMT